MEKQKNIDCISLLEPGFQTGFPIADERQQERYKNFLLLIETSIKKGSENALDKISSMITSYSLQLESYIETLSSYNNEHHFNEGNFESSPLSYSLKVFKGNLEALRSFEKALNESFAKESGKEFDPG